MICSICLDLLACRLINMSVRRALLPFTALLPRFDVDFIFLGARHHLLFVALDVGVLSAFVGTP